MRWLFGFICVLALGVMGCSEAAGTGGSGGVGGDGGSGGIDLCEGVTCEDVECKSDGVCDPSDGMCDFTLAEDGTTCSEGECLDGVCALVGTFPCTEQGIRDAITLGRGPHVFACDGPTTVVTEAEIVIDNDVTLDGEGNLTVDGDRAHRVFSVVGDATAQLRGFEVAGGATSGAGGGILNRGTLTVTNSAVSANTAGGNGGGIDNHGALTLKDSTVSGNSGGSGGGIYVGHFGTLTVTNSTLSGNTTESCGGGIDVDGTVTVTSSTILGNTSNDCGGGLFNEGSLLVVSTIVSGNTKNDCDGGITSNGYNIESPLDTCGFDQPTDQVNLSAEALALGPLQDNGGPTETHALGAGSVAIDQIPAMDCRVRTDQRGEPRPYPGGTMCDVGAFELGKCASDDDCDDDDHCTDDVCDPATGICEHNDWCI